MPQAREFNAADSTEKSVELRKKRVKMDQDDSLTRLEEGMTLLTRSTEEDREDEEDEEDD